MKLLGLLGTALAAALMTGCGGPAAPPAPRAPGPVAQPQPARPTPAVLPKEPEPGPPLRPMAYQARGRRDPFTPIVPEVVAEAPKGLNVGNVKLVGVVEGRQGSLALVEAADGVGYILKTGDTFGDGRVTQIAPDAVTFGIAGRPGQAPGDFTLRLRPE